VERESALNILTHPYDRLEPVTKGHRQLKKAATHPGAALVWKVSGRHDEGTARFAERRPGGLALIVILPRSMTLEENPALLDAVCAARPRGILPHHYGPRAADLAEVLRCPPLDMAADVTDYLAWRGIALDRDTTNIIRQIFDLSARTRTINGLARAMYMSRRALGRRLSDRGLPVPSHWLQFARLLRLASRLQNSEASIFSIAYELGYPDGFAVSNQMHRLIGYRPSVVRERLGWDWIVESWLRREAAGGGLAPHATLTMLDPEGSPGAPPAMGAPPSMTAPGRARPLRQPGTTP
jgi:AraC-like DNA-binding protein